MKDGIEMKSHSHKFVVSSFEAIDNDKSITARLKCVLCGYMTDVRIKHDIDVVSIDGKPYFIPKGFFVYDPVALDKTSIKPSVEYVKLTSGLYVPVKYVSEEVMKKLEDLDAEYATREMLRRMDHDDTDLDYPTFKEIYKRSIDIIIEQAETLKKELEKSGFRFETYISGRDLVVIIEKDRKSYFRVYNYMDALEKKGPILFGFMGKWSLLGVAVFKLAMAGTLIPRYSYIDIPKQPSSLIDMYATPKEYTDGVIFITPRHEVAAARHEPISHQTYFVKYEHVGDVYIALSYTPFHGTELVIRKTKYIEKGELVLLSHESLVCKECGTVLFEKPPGKIRVPADSISINMSSSVQ